MSDEFDALVARNRALLAEAEWIRREARERVARARQRTAVAQQVARRRGVEPLRVFWWTPTESGINPPEDTP